MKQQTYKRLANGAAALLLSGACAGLAASHFPAEAEPVAKAPVAKTAAMVQKATGVKATGAKVQPEEETGPYVSLETIQKWHSTKKAPSALPILQPLLGGSALSQDEPLMNLGTGVIAPAPDGVTEITSLSQLAPEHREQARTLLAQAFPVPPAPVRPGNGTTRPRPPVRKTVIPRWVRYPLEFQLCGISLGTRAVDKDEFNRIDRYGLFAIHGNPTAVVVGGQHTLNQQPPEVNALFETAKGELPGWAGAISVGLPGGHVEWLYNRGAYSMGFVVDRLGFVDAIVVAGIGSDIARPQLEDPLHTVKLGDDLRKVMFRYGYPDTLETYQVNAIATGGANGAYRTFELRYEQSYNIVFSIQNNRVTRIYIFGDPDFFNERRRELLRTKY